MRVLILGDAFSAHIIKWANGLYDRGVDLLIYSLSDYNPPEFRSGIRIESFKVPQYIKWQSDGNILKSAYLLSLPKLTKIIKSFDCHVLHAHSASSYGLIGALSNFHPYFISVWGNDVYNYPQKFILFRKLLEYTLGKADRIFSTSLIMAHETQKYTSKNIRVIPFGIDINKFSPSPKENKDELVIGTIKSLEPKYGVLELFFAFKLLKEKYPRLPLKLLLVGRGSLDAKMRALVKENNLDDSVTITGFVSYSEIEKYHNKVDIYVALSNQDSESFGVAVLEASACEKPVIVSNKGGLPEVVENNVTGFIIPPGSSEILTEHLEKLILDETLRIKFGKNGRQRVIDKFDFNMNLDELAGCYNEISPSMART